MLLGGVMMGKLATSLDEPVTKTLGGLVVLPGRSPAGRLVPAGPEAGGAHRPVGLRPVPLLHRAVPALPAGPSRSSRTARCSRSASTGPQSPMIAGTLYCCECNLCSLYACPENLDPKNVCTFSKPVARELKLFWSGNPADVAAAPAGRRATRADEAADREAGADGVQQRRPARRSRSGARAGCVLPLKQHAGAPAAPWSPSARACRTATWSRRRGRRAGRAAAREHRRRRARGRDAIVIEA